MVSAKDNYRYFVQLNYELLIEFTISFSKSHSLNKIIKNGQKMKKYNCMFYRNPEIRFDKNEKTFWTVTPESFLKIPKIKACVTRHQKKQYVVVINE